MDFAENLEMTHIVNGGGTGVILFVSLWRIAYENRHKTHPLHINTLVTIEKMEPHNYDWNSITIDFPVMFFQKIV